jgi:glycosyltransferase involved in cell wall biosynthesis
MDESNPAMTAAATVVFTTHNRRELLHRAITSAKAQTVPVEIIVMDDNSADGTSGMMKRYFPDIPYHRSSSGRGPCFHRNRGVALAQSDIVFALDDDSVLQSPHTVEQTLAEFDNPQVGAVAIPFVNVLQTHQIVCRPPSERGVYVTAAFVAASHAVRKEVFLHAGGYRELFFYMGEEADLCIRMLQTGLGVRLGRADPIHHYQPRGRVSFPADFYGRRNDILFLTYNAPAKYLIPFLIGTTIKGLLFGARVGRTGSMTKGLLHGYMTAIQRWRERQPVCAPCFRCFRQLKINGATEIDNIRWYFESQSSSCVKNPTGILDELCDGRDHVSDGP